MFLKLKCTVMKHNWSLYCQ